MRLSLKAKLTALISFLVLLVVLATSSLYLSSLTARALEEIESKGQYVANETYHHARSVLARSRMPAGGDPANSAELRNFVQAQLAADPGLALTMESAVGYSPTIYYVALTDTAGVVMAHNDPGEIGRRFTPAPPYNAVVRAGLLHQLRVIYGGPLVYEMVLPLEMGGKPLGDVRVGISNLFLRNQITPALRAALSLSALAVVLATFSAGVLSFRLLRPLQAISQSVDQMTRGEYSARVSVDRTDEWGVLSSKLNLLGEQIRGEKAAYLALKENLDQLFSNLTDGLMFFDKQERLVLATPASSRLLGRAPEALVGRPAAEVFAGDGPLEQCLREAFRARRSLPWRVIEMPAGASVPRVAASLQFVPSDDKPVAGLVTLRDAATRLQLEDRINLTAKWAALGHITSGVAHEVKNPLNAMVLQLEILKAKLQGQGEQVKPQIEILSSEIRRLDRVVKTFLDFTRPVELHLAETDLADLVREVFTLAEPHALEHKVRLVYDSNGALPPVRVDRDLMKQALLNLVLNGCQAMPWGGELKVTPHARPHGVELEISDQGVGIPPEAQSKIFTLYFTTKTGGTGVGLAMSYRIIQLHNGSIEFTSEVNRGTTFRVSLPR